MKVSEVIIALSAILNKHGDLEVGCAEGEYTYNHEIVDEISVNENKFYNIHGIPKDTKIVMLHQF